MINYNKFSWRIFVRKWFVSPAELQKIGAQAQGNFSELQSRKGKFPPASFLVFERCPLFSALFIVIKSANQRESGNMKLASVVVSAFGVAMEPNNFVINSAFPTDLNGYIFSSLRRFPHPIRHFKAE